MIGTMSVKNEEKGKINHINKQITTTFYLFSVVLLASAIRLCSGAKNSQNKNSDMKCTDHNLST